MESLGDPRGVGYVQLISLSKSVQGPRHRLGPSGDLTCVDGRHEIPESDRNGYGKLTEIGENSVTIT